MTLLKASFSWYYWKPVDST